MNLRQELTGTSVVDAPWSAPTDRSAPPATPEAVPDQVIDGGPPRPGHGGRPAPSTASYLDAVRAAAPLPRRPIDRVLRLVDVVGAVFGLVVTAPLLVLAGLAIRASSGGPAFYSQVRVGRDGVPFPCHKLRTMGSDAEHQLVRLLDHPEYVAQWHRARKLDHDPRVTPIGRLLRSTDLDELPQLWNVLKGDMSLVGPRPVPADEAERYRDDLASVLSVRPGMTGMWQVGGRHQVSYRTRVELDVAYVERRGVSTNLRLIMRTVGLIAARRNGAT